MSILSKLDRFRWTLVDTGQAFNTIFKVDRIGFIFFDLIDLTLTDLSTVSTTLAFLLVIKSVVAIPALPHNHSSLQRDTLVGNYNSLKYH